ncbi:MAG TPA: sugar ABC transporter ATP-binding protein [Clostridia bacterium]|nr:sugar ABC transporter ATP-binding protein [Clostridia bacterium]
MKTDTILRMTDIKKSFGNVHALKGVGIELYKGEILALMGENGAGKSTLMNVLSGALGHYEGEIELQGKPVRISTPLGARNLGIAKIHQELQMVSELTVAENIFLGREPGTCLGFVNYRKMNNAAREYLDTLELHVKPNQQVKSLRVGEQQLVEIAKALSLNAGILIMDEPTSALSKGESQKLFQVIRKLSGEGVSIIYITHRMEEVFELADRITVLRDGELIGTVKTESTDRDELIRMMVGRTLKEIFLKEKSSRGEEILRIEGLSFFPPDYSSKRRLQDVSFSLHKGEVLGIAGLMGAGRSELFECLFGVHGRHCNARMFIEGRPVAIKNPADAIKHGISFVTEDRKKQGLVLGRSIGENMSLPLLRFFSRLVFMNRIKEKESWKQQIGNLKIKAPGAGTLAGELSGGNQQKVVLGRWLLTDPKILLLDEPTRGIDVGAKAEIYQLINKLAKEGMGIIVISSELPEIIGVSDRIITFCEGRMTGEFIREEATQEKLLAAATLREVVKANVN